MEEQQRTMANQTMMEEQNLGAMEEQTVAASRILPKTELRSERSRLVLCSREGEESGAEEGWRGAVGC